METNTKVSTLGNDASQNMYVKMKTGAWTMVRNVDFGEHGASAFTVRAKGSGTVRVRLGSKTATPVATLEFSSTGLEDHTIEVDPEKTKGVKSMYIIFSNTKDVRFDSWQFTEAKSTGIDSPVADAQPADAPRYYDLSGRRLSPSEVKGKVVIEEFEDQQGVRHVRKRMF